MSLMGGTDSYVAQLDSAVKLGTMKMDEKIGVKYVQYAKVVADHIREQKSKKVKDKSKLGKQKYFDRVEEDDKCEKSNNEHFELDEKDETSEKELQEIERMQEEVSYHIKMSNVVTFQDPSAAPVPYKLQGNLAVNTPPNLYRRRTLRTSPLIREIVEEYWSFPPLQRHSHGHEGNEVIDKGAYTLLNRKIHRALVPGTSVEEAVELSELDWERDVKCFDGQMNFNAFFSGLFELADIWTENIDEEEYAAFLWLLLETIVDTTSISLGFKEDSSINHILDLDMQTIVARYQTAIEMGRIGSSLPEQEQRLQDMRNRWENRVNSGVILHAVPAAKNSTLGIPERENDILSNDNDNIDNIESNSVDKIFNNSISDNDSNSMNNEGDDLGENSLYSLGISNMNDVTSNTLMTEEESINGSTNKLIDIKNTKDELDEIKDNAIKPFIDSNLSKDDKNSLPNIHIEDNCQSLINKVSNGGNETNFESFSIGKTLTSMDTDNFNPFIQSNSTSAIDSKELKSPGAILPNDIEILRKSAQEGSALFDFLNSHSDVRILKRRATYPEKFKAAKELLRRNSYISFDSNSHNQRRKNVSSLTTDSNTSILNVDDESDYYAIENASLDAINVPPIWTNEPGSVGSNMTGEYTTESENTNTLSTRSTPKNKGVGSQQGSARGAYRPNSHLGSGRKFGDPSGIEVEGESLGISGLPKSTPIKEAPLYNLQNEGKTTFTLSWQGIAEAYLPNSTGFSPRNSENQSTKKPPFKPAGSIKYIYGVSNSENSKLYPGLQKSANPNDFSNLEFKKEENLPQILNSGRKVAKSTQNSARDRVEGPQILERGSNSRQIEGALVKEAEQNSGRKAEWERYPNLSKVNDVLLGDFRGKSGGDSSPNSGRKQYKTPSNSGRKNVENQFLSGLTPDKLSANSSLNQNKLGLDLNSKLEGESFPLSIKKNDQDIKNINEKSQVEKPPDSVQKVIKSQLNTDTKIPPGCNSDESNGNELKSQWESQELQGEKYRDLMPAGSFNSLKKSIGHSGNESPYAEYSLENSSSTCGMLPFLAGGTVKSPNIPLQNDSKMNSYEKYGYERYAQNSGYAAFHAGNGINQSPPLFLGGPGGDFKTGPKERTGAEFKIGTQPNQQYLNDETNEYLPDTRISSNQHADDPMKNSKSTAYKRDNRFINFSNEKNNISNEIPNFGNYQTSSIDDKRLKRNETSPLPKPKPKAPVNDMPKTSPNLQAEQRNRLAKHTENLATMLMSTVPPSGPGNLLPVMQFERFKPTKDGLQPSKSGTEATFAVGGELDPSVYTPVVSCKVLLEVTLARSMENNGSKVGMSRGSEEVQFVPVHVLCREDGGHILSFDARVTGHQGVQLQALLEKYNTSFCDVFQAESKSACNTHFENIKYSHDATAFLEAATVLIQSRTSVPITADEARYQIAEAIYSGECMWSTIEFNIDNSGDLAYVRIVGNDIIELQQKNNNKKSEFSTILKENYSVTDEITEIIKMVEDLKIGNLILELFKSLQEDKFEQPKEAENSPTLKILNIEDMMDKICNVPTTTYRLAKKHLVYVNLILTGTSSIPANGSTNNEGWKYSGGMPWRGPGYVKYFVPAPFNLALSQMWRGTVSGALGPSRDFVKRAERWKQLCEEWESHKRSRRKMKNTDDFFQSESERIVNGSGWQNSRSREVGGGKIRGETLSPRRGKAGLAEDFKAEASNSFLPSIEGSEISLSGLTKRPILSRAQKVPVQSPMEIPTELSPLQKNSSTGLNMKRRPTVIGKNRKFIEIHKNVMEFSKKENTTQMLSNDGNGLHTSKSPMIKLSTNFISPDILDLKNSQNDSNSKWQCPTYQKVNAIIPPKPKADALFSTVNFNYPTIRLNELFKSNLESKNNDITHFLKYVLPGIKRNENKHLFLGSKKLKEVVNESFEGIEPTTSLLRFDLPLNRTRFTLPNRPAGQRRFSRWISNYDPVNNDAKEDLFLKNSNEKMNIVSSKAPISSSDSYSRVAQNSLLRYHPRHGKAIRNKTL